MAEENKETNEDKDEISVSKSLEKLMSSTKVELGDKAGDNRDFIINMSFRDNNSGNKVVGEVVDIVNDYQWTIDKFVNNDGYCPIPVCYLVEYKQSHNSAITNFINSVVVGANAIKDGINEIQKTIDDVTTLMSDLIASSSEEVNNQEDNKPPQTGAATSNNNPTTPNSTPTPTPAPAAAIDDNGAPIPDPAPSPESLADTLNRVKNENGVASAQNVSSSTPSSENTQTKSTETPETSKDETDGVKSGSEKSINLSKFKKSLISVYNKLGLDKAASMENHVVGNSTFLKPYSLLYWLNPTKKRYTFPMIANPQLFKVSNSYGDQNNDYSVISANSYINLISQYARAGAAFVKDLQDFRNINTKDDTKDYSAVGVEKSKFFQYPQDTEEYTIQFPLINTVHSGGRRAYWKDNYRFLFMFCLRNMLYRKDNAQFYPPLFYDLFIPGVVREPYCYVSSVQIVPFGIVRQKSLSASELGIKSISDNGNQKIIVPVPEQWHVTIKLKSLVAHSANMLLSGIFDLNISVEERLKDVDNKMSTLGDSISNISNIK